MNLYRFTVVLSMIVLKMFVPTTFKLRGVILALMVIEVAIDYVPMPMLDLSFQSIFGISLVHFIQMATLSTGVAVVVSNALKNKSDVTSKVDDIRTEQLETSMALKYEERTYEGNREQYQIPVYCGKDEDAIQETTQQESIIIKHSEKLNFPTSQLQSIDFSSAMDANDPLASFKDMFYVSSSTIYMCGNSLGLQPKSTAPLMQDAISKWRSKAVKGHFCGEYPWFNLEDKVVDIMANIVGAKPVEVAVMGSLTSNLHSLLTSFYKPTPNRFKILMEENPFPSDMHAITTHILSRRDLNKSPQDVIVQIGARHGDHNILTQDILSMISSSPFKDQVALILLGGINFMTGELFDIEKITKEAHKHGIIVGFDLAHCVGNVELKLNEWDVDFAVWCSYKYMNAGPGMPAGIFVHERFADCSVSELPRMSGWWGHKRSDRFSMTNQFVPSRGAAGFQCSTPNAIGNLCVLSGLQLFEKARGMKPLREKSLLLTSYLEFLLSNSNDLLGEVEIITPSNPERRGCQISIRIINEPMKNVNRGLDERGIVCDEREPNIIRISPTPMYNSFSDVRKTVEGLIDVISELKSKNVKEGIALQSLDKSVA
ncbi:kynureninase [Acrasis kona]|uniref:Kynureninase n=1 Tax=Acrasis kona TaxID=1008807 RepID=A0AAW2ZGU7_9EUKA